MRTKKSKKVGVRYVFLLILLIFENEKIKKLLHLFYLLFLCCCMGSNMYNNIACTIFSNTTWGENVDWRRRHRHSGCIYGSPTDIGVSTTSAGSTMYVIEMNNDQNRIMGVGKIVCGAASCADAAAGNRMAQRMFNVYESRSYNRYKFVGKERVDREFHIDVNPKLASIFKRLDWMLFKTARHAKRGRGIQRIPKWISEVAERRCNYTLSRFFDQLFLKTLSASGYNGISSLTTRDEL